MLQNQIKPLTIEDLKKLHDQMPTYPMNINCMPDYAHADVYRSTEEAFRNNLLERRKVDQEQRSKLEKFKDLYRKIRADNIILDHQSAIELVKMIEAEANTLTLGDFI